MRNITWRDRLLAVGAVVDSRKMAKHFSIEIGEGHFGFRRRTEQIAAETRLDGIYVIRTSVPAEQLDADEAVQAYKDLSRVERAFSNLKAADLAIRPIRHWTADRVRAHVFLCMLAYYAEWHMRHALAPILFDDHDRAAAQAQRQSIVAPATRSSKALDKVHSQRTDDGQPVHRFQTLMADLSTITKNTAVMNNNTMHIVTTPTPLQQRVFDLLSRSHLWLHLFSSLIGGRPGAVQPLPGHAVPGWISPVSLVDRVYRHHGPLPHILAFRIHWVEPRQRRHVPAPITQ